MPMTIRERLWKKASADQRRVAVVALAAFLSRFYAKYDYGKRHRVRQEQVTWLWIQVTSEQHSDRPAIRLDRDEDRFIPDVDFDPTPDAAIGQVAAIAV